MPRKLVITEKPSVARDIAKAIGGFDDHEEYLESEDFVVTWALGHLLELAAPKDYNKEWGSWSIKLLPIIPETFQIVPRTGQKKRLDLIKKLGKRDDVVGLIDACDAGREGESIYRRIVQYCGLEERPHERLWMQSMTADAIRAAFAKLRPGSDFDRLADAAHLRSVGDWLIGLNATRALTQRFKSRGEQASWSAGRVQTPTLKILVDREHEILAHVPRPYWAFLADFDKGDPSAHAWQGRFTDDSLKGDDKDQRADRVFDEALMARIRDGLAKVDSGLASETRHPSQANPPGLFDLTLLQREANKRYSLPAKRTLDAAQRLYEQHKLLTYPRTDSKHLPSDYEPTIREILGNFAAGALDGDQAKLSDVAGRVLNAGPRNLDKLLDSTKITDHFAIIPTGALPSEPLSGDDARVWDLVLRQFLAAMMGPATYANVERIVTVTIDGAKRAFKTTAKSLEVPGFMEALGRQVGDGTTLPALVPGQDKVTDVPVRLKQFTVEAKETKPPPHMSEAQLLRAMETAGSAIEDEELAEAMSARGLGTPATRADTIEKLIRTGYVRRVEGKLAPSSKAMRLMDLIVRVDVPTLASPKLTGEWEFALGQVERGEIPASELMSRLVDTTRVVVDSLVSFEQKDLYAKDAPLGLCPDCGAPVVENAWAYPCSKNEGKTGGCRFILWKDKNGRYIDRLTAQRLLAERRVGPISGFVDRSGKQTYMGTLALVAVEGVHQLEFEQGAVVDDGDMEPEVEEGVLCPDPEDPSAEIVVTNYRYVSRRLLENKVRQAPVLPRSVCQREISEEEALAFFSEAGRTELLLAFISKRGRPFKGMLIRKPNGRHGFEFPEREPRPARGKAAAEKPPAKGAKGKAAAEDAAAAAPAKKASTKKASAKAAADAPAKPAKKASVKASADAPAKPAKKAAAKKPAAKKAAAAPEPAPEVAAAKPKTTRLKKATKADAE